MRIPEISFVAIVERGMTEPADLPGVIEICNNESLAGRFDLPVSFAGGTLARIILNFVTLPITAYGTLTFRLRLSNEITASVEIKVVQPSALAQPGSSRMQSTPS